MSVPDIGTMWRSSSQKKLFRVVHVDPRRVLLQGDTGMVEIPVYDWPLPDLAPVIDQETVAPRALSALLVGGAEGSHFIRVWEQAADLGVDLMFHWNMELRQLPSSLPAGIDLVILLVSHMTHDKQEKVKSIAKGSVPIARVASSGFRHQLQQELTKLGFDEGFGGLAERQRPSSEGHYSWTGVTYEWREHRPESTEVAQTNSESMMALAVMGFVALFVKILG